MDGWRAVALFVGRLLIAALFVGGSVQKMIDPEPVRMLLSGVGWPVVLVWPALVFNALAGLALIVGVGVRWLAVLLAGYTAVTSLFHFIPEDPWQMSIFVKNWAIVGGCLCLAAAGSGRIAWRPD